MSTFGNIERLGTRLVGVQTSQNRWVKGRLRSRRNLSIGERENGASGEQIVRYVFFAGSTLNWSTTEILSMASEHLKTLG